MLYSRFWALQSKMKNSIKVKFLPLSEFKWIDSKEFDLNQYTSNSSKGCILDVDLEYPKELCELHNDYRLAPDKIETKREILSNYQIKIADFYKIPIGNVKKLVPNFFDKESIYFIIKTCIIISDLGYN